MLLLPLFTAAPTPPALLIPGRILALSALSLTARALLAEAYARQRRSRNTSLSNNRYARHLGYPVHRIQSALAEQERAGYLVRHYMRPLVSRQLRAGRHSEPCRDQPTAPAIAPYSTQKSQRCPRRYSRTLSGCSPAGKAQ